MSTIQEGTFDKRLNKKYTNNLFFQRPLKAKYTSGGKT